MKTIFSEPYTISIVLDDQEIDIEFVIHGQTDHHRFKKNHSSFKESTRKILKNYERTHVIYKNEYIHKYKQSRLFIVDDGKDRIHSFLSHLLHLIVEIGNIYHIPVQSLHCKYGVIKNTNIK